MSKKLAAMVAAVLMISISPVAVLPAEATPDPCENGAPMCIKTDANGNLWICGPSICIPWDTSMPPLPPPDPD